MLDPSRKVLEPHGTGNWFKGGFHLENPIFLSFWGQRIRGLSLWVAERWLCAHVQGDLWPWLRRTPSPLSSSIFLCTQHLTLPEGSGEMLKRGPKTQKNYGWRSKGGSWGPSHQGSCNISNSGNKDHFAKQARKIRYCGSREGCPQALCAWQEGSWVFG